MLTHISVCLQERWLGTLSRQPEIAEGPGRRGLAKGACLAKVEHSNNKDRAGVRKDSAATAALS